MKLVCGVKCQGNGYSQGGRRDGLEGGMMTSAFSKGFTSTSTK